MSSDRLDLPESSALARVDNVAIRAARTAIQISPELKSLFDRADQEEWSEGRLSSELATSLEEYVLDTESCADVAAVLAHEHTVRDKDKILLVSRDTGLPLAQVPPEAIYLPAPVAREGSTDLAQPLPRLRPEMESAIVQNAFMRGHELARLKDLSSRSDLQLSDQDPRLLIVTSRGRKQLLERLRREVSGLLNPVPDAPGSVNEFLGVCERGDVIAGYGPELTINVEAFTAVNLVDLLSKNMQHDPYLAVRDTLRNQLVRSIAAQCASAAHLMFGSAVASVSDTLAPGLVVGSPDVVIALRPRAVLPIDGPTVAFKRGPHLNPLTFDCQARDYQRKWEVYVAVELGIRIPLAGVSVYEFSDLRESEPVVEVL